MRSKNIVSNNTKIAKNAFALSIRMIFVTLVSIYTSRVVLNALGVIDFGIYNTIASCVVLFTFISGSISGGIQRYLTYYIDRNDVIKLNRIFCVSIQIAFILIVVILLSSEILGLWFLNNKLNIPIDKINVANIIFQFSLLTIVMQIISIPYIALMIANEKLSFFALLGIIESSGKLLIAYLISISCIDRLIFYAFLLFLLSFIMFLLRYIYCRYSFIVSRYHYVKDSDIFKELLSFSSWTFLGNLASIGKIQGVSVILNIFYGVVVNTALGLVYQINAVIMNVAQNFNLSFSPQLIKSYSVGDEKRFSFLLYLSSKVSFLIIFAFIFPIMLHCEFILKIWLGSIPMYTVVFLRIVLFSALMFPLINPLVTSIQAYGKIRNYELIISFILLLNIPVAIILLRNGFLPTSVLIAGVIIELIGLIFRIFYVSKIMNFRVITYFFKIILPCSVACFISIILPIFIKLNSNSVPGFFYSNITFIVCLVFTIWVIVLSDVEKGYIKTFVKNSILRSNHK